MLRDKLMLRKKCARRMAADNSAEDESRVAVKFLLRFALQRGPLVQKKSLRDRNPAGMSVKPTFREQPDEGKTS